jgi:hypothetical protein
LVKEIIMPQPSRKDKAPDEQPPSDPTTTTETPDENTPEQSSAQQSEQMQVDLLAQEVLNGQWGDHMTARKRLTDAGHNASAIFTRVNARLANGAPSAYRPTAVGLVQQVKDGEWGAEKGLSQRLTGARFNSLVVAEVMEQLKKD